MTPAIKFGDSRISLLLNLYSGTNLYSESGGDKKKKYVNIK